MAIRDFALAGGAPLRQGARMRASIPLAVAAMLALPGCVATPAPTRAAVAAAPAAVTATATSPALADVRSPVTILISIDGFRADYLDRGLTPTLSRLAAEGTRAAMRPSFPSKTFPNHWAIVTGLRPDRNGIVSNNMEDPAGKRKKFTMATDDPWWWNAAPPIWVDAERAGIRTAAEFWPGSSVAFGGVRAEDWPNTVTGGVRPSMWTPFGDTLDGTRRVDAVIDWLRRPETMRPRFVTLYFDIVDTQGHRYGPESAQVNAAVREVDGDVGRLVSELAALGQPANLVIVADHGMAQVDDGKVVQLSTLADPADGRSVETGVFATFQPVPGHEAALARSLSRSRDHVQCWPKEKIPARFHYGSNPRIPAWFCLAEPGWRILSGPPERSGIGGEHGYDNDAPDMRALFIASGPAFVRGRTLPTFDNVDVHALLRHVIGLPPATGSDGEIGPVRDALR